jgi:hypothetical protein
MKKMVFTTAETLEAELELAHFGARDLAAANFRLRIREVAGRTVAEGQFPPRTLPTGQLTAVGEIDLPLAEFQQATALNLEITMPGTRFANDWNLWVYPATVAAAPSPNVTVASELDATTLAVLGIGGRVVLLADPRRVAGQTVGRFDPIFWNKLWFPSQPQHTLGLLLDPRHPALAQFPTAFHSDWQWQDLQNHSKPMVLDGLPKKLSPIVQVIDDWNSCRKLGLVFEARVGAGRLLVCSLDLDHDLAARPAARQLRASLLAYAASDRFKPTTALDAARVQSLFRDLTPLEKLGASARRADSQQSGYPASLALDGDPNTMWHTAWGDNAPAYPHELVVEFASPVALAGLTALPRQDGNRNGWIKGYEIFASADGQDWGTAVAQGEFPADDALKTVKFAAPVAASFLKLRALSGHANGPFASLAELGVLLPEPK